MLFCSESVSEGHPDKICDQISDAILDACLAQDSKSRVACEVFACSKKIIISGEITSDSNVNYKQVALDVLKKIDYKNDKNIDLDKLIIEVCINKQSPEIAYSVDKGHINSKNISAGDQGQMFGYACNYFLEYSNDLMPLPHTLAHALIKRASVLRKANKFLHALPDMKSQVVVEFFNNNYYHPQIKKMLMSIQHTKGYNVKEFNKYVKKNIMNYVANKYKLNTNFEYTINPSGSFLNGGWVTDTGLTGRKIIVDTYGGWSKHGGGCFSGKDPSKVDRTGAYFARYIAKNLVAAKLCDECEIQISYTIGSELPLEINVCTFNTGIINDNILTKIVNVEFNWTLSTIIKRLKLKEIKYYPLTKFGHFGINVEQYPWEQLDYANNLLKYQFTVSKHNLNS